MPHPESEHGLRVQLATALRERDEARAALADAIPARDGELAEEIARADAAESAIAAANARADAIELARVVLLADERREKHRADAADEALAAARRECEGLREHNLEMTYALIYARRNHQKDGACSKPDECDECEIARTAIRFRTALSAPAAAAGEEGKHGT